MSTSKIVLSKKDIHEYLGEVIDFTSDSDYDDKEEKEGPMTATDASEQESINLSDSDCEEDDVQEEYDYNEEAENLRKLNMVLSVLKSDSNKCFDNEDIDLVVKEIQSCKRILSSCTQQKKAIEKIKEMRTKVTSRNIILNKLSDILDCEHRFRSLYSKLKEKTHIMSSIINELETVLHEHAS